MNFIDSQHQQYFESRRGGDVYRDAVSYLLGLTAETRSHAADLFDEDGMKIEGLKEPWQTGTTAKLTRLAFNLWNGCSQDYDSKSDEYTTSGRYAVDEIFCCGLAPYFVQAIQIRYPEYFMNPTTLEIKEALKAKFGAEEFEEGLKREKIKIEKARVLKVRKDNEDV